ncbi:MAG: Gldg family protein [Bacteriovoracaceae bacterium]|nr:Gldg family protein [Bacteriovoracaceae bacterium]
MNKWFRPLLYFINGTIYLTLIALWVAIPDELTLNVSVTVFNLVFTSMIIIADRKHFSHYIYSSRFKYFSQSLLSAFLIFCILGLINYLFYKHPVMLDISQNQLNSLAKQSIKAVSSLKGPTTCTVFARKNELPSIVALLDLFRYHKNDFKIELVDIELRPDLVKKHQITRSGSVIIEHNGKKQMFFAQDELSVTNALIRVSRVSDPVIYYSIGHSELQLHNTNKDGLSDLLKMIKNAFFKISEVNLIMLDEISSEVDILIIWGPKTSFLDVEIKKIKAYLKDGGSLLVAMDLSLDGDKLSNLRAEIKKWGLDIPNNLVVDQLSHVSGSNGSVPLIQKIESKHPILREIKGPIFFPLVSSVKGLNEKVKDLGIAETMIKTTIYPASWAENTPEEIMGGKITFNSELDFQGPISLMGTFEEYKQKDVKKRRTKIVAFGNSSFVINGYSKFGNNSTLFLNSLAWLVDEDTLISLNLPSIKNEPVFISAPALGIIFYFSVIFSPIILFGLAFYLYRRKQKL